MADISIPTAASSTLQDAALFPPPKATKLLLLSRFGVLAVGTYQPEFHVAWAPLPKIPATVKDKLNEQTL